MNIKEFKTGLPVRKAVLGIDYGSKRMGLAVSDLSCTIATPYKILYRREISADMAELRKIMAENLQVALVKRDRMAEKEIGAVVMGLPLQMNGEEGEIAAEVRKFAAILEENFKFPVLLWDERLSSSAMENFLIKEADLSRKKRAKVLDASAAAYILQGALDALKYA